MEHAFHVCQAEKRYGRSLRRDVPLSELADFLALPLVAVIAESTDSMLVRLEPGDVRTWDFSDDF